MSNKSKQADKCEINLNLNVNKKNPNLIMNRSTSKAYITEKPSDGSSSGR